MWFTFQLKNALLCCLKLIIYWLWFNDIIMITRIWAAGACAVGWTSPVMSSSKPPLAALKLVDSVGTPATADSGPQCVGGFLCGFVVSPKIFQMPMERHQQTKHHVLHQERLYSPLAWNGTNKQLYYMSPTHSIMQYTEDMYVMLTKRHENMSLVWLANNTSVIGILCRSKLQGTCAIGHYQLTDVNSKFIRPSRQISG